MPVIPYRVIDLSRDPRRAHFAYFRSLQNPCVGVTVQVDVTDLVRFCREKGCSFYLTMIHAAALAADRVPEFRQRIRDGGIIEYERCGTSHAESLPDGTYGYCTLYHDMPFNEYLPYAENERARCREAASIEEDGNVDALYFISTLPWLHYTGFVQPTEGGDASNPRITWGKYEPDHRGRLMMPLTVLCHHALTDGIHLARFYSAVEETMRAIAAGEG